MLRSTVVNREEQQGDVERDSDERRLDEPDEKRTKRDGRNENVGVFRAGKRRAGEVRGWREEPLRAREPPLEFERTQRLGRGVRQEELPRFFFGIFSLLVSEFLALCAQNDQKSVSEHREGDMTIPSLPRADLIVIQADLTFTLLKTLLHCPAGSDDLGEARKRGLSGRKNEDIGQLCRFLASKEAASNDQPTLPPLLARGSEFDPCPIKKPCSFAPFPCREAMPAL